MSHELRTPLNAIIGFSEVLQERMFGEINDKQAEYLRRHPRLGRAPALPDQRHPRSLEDRSRPHGSRAVELQRAAALDNALTLIRERATRHGITLELVMRCGDRRMDRRRAQVQADPAEPALERGEVHAARAARSASGAPHQSAPSRSPSPTPASASSPRISRSSSRNSARSGGDQLEEVGRHRARACADEEIRRAARRHADAAERSRKGLDVHVHAARAPPPCYRLKMEACGVKC